MSMFSSVKGPLYNTLIAIYFAFLGREKIVVLNSLEKVRETLVEKQNDFAGRPIAHSSELMF